MKALAKGVTLQQHVGVDRFAVFRAQWKSPNAKSTAAKYFCCTRGPVTSRCQDLFPPHPFFKGKVLGTMLENYREFPGSGRKPYYSQEFPRSFSLFLFEYSPENECWCKLAQKKKFQEFLVMVLGKSQEIPGFSLRNFARETGEYRSYFGAFGRKKKYFLTVEIQARIILHMLQVKIKFRLKFLNLSWFAISFVS